MKIIEPHTPGTGSPPPSIARTILIPNLRRIVQGFVENGHRVDEKGFDGGVGGSP